MGIQSMRNGGISRQSGDAVAKAGGSAEILAGRSDFVPTGSSRVCPTVVDWQTAMKRAIRSTAGLKQMLGIPPTVDGEQNKAFPCFVPLEYVARIRPGDPDDPLLRQVMPTAQEWVDTPGFTADPVGDRQAVAAGGLLHKYDGRVLVVATGACGVHCRYCFRREFPYADYGSTNQNWQPALDYISSDRTIEEVILSGGDPLTLTDQKLDTLITAIEQIDHVRRLRIHTRMPIVIPQRLTAALVSRLAASRLATWMVIHANHPRELDENVLTGIRRCIDAGVPVLNQTVLMRGINDTVDVLVDLSRTLVNHCVQPYYLHQLDRVRGAGHFEVPVEMGQQLMRSMRQALPGYAVPTYVIEQAGHAHKTII